MAINNTERIGLKCTKEFTEEVQKAAANLGLTVSGYIKLAVNEKIAADKKRFENIETPTPPVE